MVKKLTFIVLSTIFLGIVSEVRADASLPSILVCKSDDGFIKNVSNIRQVGYQHTAIITDQKTKKSFKIKVTKDVLKDLKLHPVTDEAGNVKAHVKRKVDGTFEVKTEFGRIYICQ